MDGINFTKILDTKTQLCAGIKITKPKQAFFEFTDHVDPKKMEFKKTAPINYEVKTEVNRKHILIFSGSSSKTRFDSIETRLVPAKIMDHNYDVCINDHTYVHDVSCIMYYPGY